MTDYQQSGQYARHLDSKVFFYRLSRKFVDDKFDVPQEAKEIMYYTLAIGHHLGIVDCLKSEMDCSGQEYLDWIAALDHESEAYRKMHGFFVFGEITVFPEHLNMLALAFDRIDSATQSEKSQAMTKGFLAILNTIYNEPHMYLMIRSNQ